MFDDVVGVLLGLGAEGCAWSRGLPMIGVTAQPIRKAPTCPSLAVTRVDLTSSGGLDDLDQGGGPWPR